MVHEAMRSTGARDGVELRPRGLSAVPERLSLPGIAAEHVDLPSDAAFDFMFRGGSHYLALHDLVLTDGEISVDGTSGPQLKDLRGALTYVPPGAEVRGWSNLGGRRGSFTAIYFDINELLASFGQGSHFTDPRVYVRDQRVESALSRLRKALQAGGPLDLLLAETLSSLAVLDLARLLTDTRSRQVTLGPQRRKLVEDFIEANLHQEVTLEQMAQVVGLSRYHFLRAYRSETGLTPYQRVVASRCDRAIELLLNGEAPAAAAARSGHTSTEGMWRQLAKRRGLRRADFTTKG